MHNLVRSFIIVLLFTGVSASASPTSNKDEATLRERLMVCNRMLKQPDSFCTCIQPLLFQEGGDTTDDAGVEGSESFPISKFVSRFVLTTSPFRQSEVLNDPKQQYLYHVRCVGTSDFEQLYLIFDYDSQSLVNAVVD